ncbi:MAG TPA: hypothetical protein VFR32_00190 [Gaiellaceae bacterium]|nr:hypothetical protein [Gaiellaceae bacterium]
MAEVDAAGTRLDGRLADWEARLDRLEALLANETAAVNGSHVLFVPSPSGYELLERAGSSPAPGDSVDLDGRDGRYAVLRVGRSLLPGDERAFVYVTAT